MLLGSSPAIVEGQNQFIWKTSVGGDEADAREQLARMELDLGDNLARLRPALHPVVEVDVVPDDMVRWPSRSASG